MSDADFRKATASFLRALGRRYGPGLEYLLVREWVNGIPHAHALLIAPGVTRKAIRSAIAATGGLLRCSCRPLRKPPAAAVKYIFKHTRRPEKKAELTPNEFRGRMFTTSRGFLIRPVKQLWREVRETHLRDGGISHQKSDASTRAEVRETHLQRRWNAQNPSNPMDGPIPMETQVSKTDDGQFMAVAPQASERIVCGAKLRRQAGQFCKRSPAPGRTRCMLHGGRTPRGADSPHFKHGLFSRAVPKTIRKDFDELMRDPALLDCRAEIAVLQIRMSQLTARVGTNESGAAWKNLDRLLDKFGAEHSAGNESGTLAALDRMRAIIKGEVNDTEAWTDIQRAIEAVTRLSARESKRQVTMQRVATAEQVRALVASITNAVLQNVPDLSTRQKIALTVNSLRVIEPVDPDEFLPVDGESEI